MQKKAAKATPPLTKAIFLDRDGTINFNAEYISDPRKISLLHNAVEGLRILQKQGFKLIIVTNQSGIARGYFSEKDLGRVNGRLLTLLEKEGIVIDGIYFCPYHRDGKVKRYRKDSQDRKPAPGMILKAAQKHFISLRDSYMIGDSQSDILAGKNAKCGHTILIDPDRAKGYGQDFTARDLLEAAVWIRLREQEKKLVSREALPAFVRSLRKSGKRIVFTNGVFDLIHPGHLHYLALCRGMGDFLIVGLNSDSSVKANKGEKRPINNESFRVEMLASLPFVDAITVFGEKDPRPLINIIRPSIHVKDDNYTVEQIVEYEDVRKHGGKTVLLPRIKDYSTTRMIQTIREKF
jgi:D-glycero-D-manno-heptose 1,7-bisphosphate phosphatase